MGSGSKTCRLTTLSTDLMALFKETAAQRFQRETHEVWLKAKERMEINLDLKVAKGEKSKKKDSEKRKLKDAPQEDLKEVTKSNFNLLRRKLSANIVRKI